MTRSKRLNKKWHVAGSREEDILFSGKKHRRLKHLSPRSNSKRTFFTTDRRSRRAYRIRTPGCIHPKCAPLLDDARLSRRAAFGWIAWFANRDAMEQNSVSRVRPACEYGVAKLTKPAERSSHRRMAKVLDRLGRWVDLITITDHGCALLESCVWSFATVG